VIKEKYKTIVQNFRQTNVKSSIIKKEFGGIPNWMTILKIIQKSTF
jgi:hypothetical protein